MFSATIQTYKDEETLRHNPSHGILKYGTNIKLTYWTPSDLMLFHIFDRDVLLGADCNLRHGLTGSGLELPLG
ncbi:hypothetical protein D791_00274 [Nitrincola nitratireducens]|uniref:Uncharacterized protein n=1 Tax=Nitrincola nitratireducens TaxID=1229521 RepID=W9VA63_9GAMM|nr:hypothetical protein D791_00274 [Nitrincola nitratireducens]